MEAIQDLVAGIFLLPGKIELLVLTFLFGYYGKRHRIFTFGLILFCTTLIFNLFLKDYFRVPLPESLGKEGYAFPSGHMMRSVAFWSYLALEFRSKIFTTIMIPSLIGLGWSLCYFNFHYPSDIYAAIGGGLLSTLAFRKLQTLPTIEKNPFSILLYILPLTALFTVAMYLMNPASSLMKPILLQVIMIIFTACWSTHEKFFRKYIEYKPCRVLAVMLATVGLTVIFTVRALLKNHPDFDLHEFYAGGILLLWITLIPSAISTLIFSKVVHQSS